MAKAIIRSAISALALLAVVPAMAQITQLGDPGQILRWSDPGISDSRIRPDNQLCGPGSILGCVIYQRTDLETAAEICHRHATNTTWSAGGPPRYTWTADWVESCNKIEAATSKLSAKIADEKARHDAEERAKKDQPQLDFVRGVAEGLK